MTAAITDTAVDYGPDLGPVSRLPQRDSLTAMTALTADTAADDGLDLASVSRSQRRASLRAVSSARRHEHGLLGKDIGAMNEPLTRDQWLLSLPQAQAALGGIGLTLLYKLIDTGSIRRVKIGRRAFITQASVDAFVASLTAA
jgi:hypothetical protein